MAQKQLSQHLTNLSYSQWKEALVQLTWDSEEASTEAGAGVSPCVSGEGLLEATGSTCWRPSRSTAIAWGFFLLLAGGSTLVLVPASWSSSSRWRLVTPRESSPPRLEEALTIPGVDIEGADRLEDTTLVEGILAVTWVEEVRTNTVAVTVECWAEFTAARGVTWAVGAVVVVWIAIGRILAVGVVVTVGLTAALSCSAEEPSDMEGGTTFLLGPLSLRVCWSLEILAFSLAISASWVCLRAASSCCEVCWSLLSSSRSALALWASLMAYSWYNISTYTNTL